MSNLFAIAHPGLATAQQVRDEEDHLREIARAARAGSGT
ncbi:hypothetical protein P3T39_004894 [Kitasatospora sp. GP82]|nr:hypothetical protein [Kitasatospora sp. GP82]